MESNSTDGAPIPQLVKARLDRQRLELSRGIVWHEMREKIIPLFPASRKTASEIKPYMQRIEETYVTDAYHSLSIEGYRVSREIIERVRDGNWNPDNVQAHRRPLRRFRARLLVS